MNKNNCGTLKYGACSHCPFNSNVERVLYCPSYFEDINNTKLSMMDKIASWQQVAAKGRAIVENGGVTIIKDIATEIESYVTSLGIDEHKHKVYKGGPYNVILSKRSWELQHNVGGWIQGYLCSCKWGFYNMGEPGLNYQGRMCSHAYATLLVANARARQEFFGDRKASVHKMILECKKCHNLYEVSNNNSKLGMFDMCDDCARETIFYDLVDEVLGTKHANLLNKESEVIDRILQEIEIKNCRGNKVATWRGLSKNVTASRHLTADEILELETEFQGKPLKNKDKLKNNGGVFI